MQERLPLVIFLTVCLMTVAYSTIGIYTPAMPAIAEHFQASAAEVQLTFSAYLVAFSFGQLLYGPLSDRYGRRPAIFAGLVIYVAGSAFAALAWSIEALIAARALQALGGCAGPVLARAMMRDLFDRDQSARLMSIVTMVMGVAPAFAPVIGGYVQVAFGWEAIFWLLTGLGALVLALFAVFLEETHARHLRQVGGGIVNMVMAYPRLMRSRLFIGYTLNGGFAMTAIFVYSASAPFVLIELLGVRPDLYGWYTLAPTASNLVGAWTATRLTMRLGTDRMMLMGSLFVMAGGGLMLVLALVAPLSVLTIVLPMGIVTFGLANLFPSAAQSAVSVAPRAAGAASSLNGFLIMLMSSFGVVLVGFVPAASELPLAIVEAAIGVCAVLTLLLVWGRSAPAADEEEPARG